MVALCYADKFVTERTDDVSEVLIEDSAISLRRLKIAALCYADKSVTERTACMAQGHFFY